MAITFCLSKAADQCLRNKWL